MRIKEKLRKIADLIGYRQVGHTTLAKKGIQNYDREFLVVSHKVAFSKELVEENKLGKAVSLESATPGKPAVVDHALLEMTMRDAIAEIEFLEETADAQRQLLEKATELAEIFQDRSHELEKLWMDRVACGFWQFERKRVIDEKIYGLIEQTHQERKAEETLKRMGAVLAKNASILAGTRHKNFSRNV